MSGIHSYWIHKQKIYLKFATNGQEKKKEKKKTKNRHPMGKHLNGAWKRWENREGP